MPVLESCTEGQGPVQGGGTGTETLYMPPRGRTDRRTRLKALPSPLH